MPLDLGLVLTVQVCFWLRDQYTLMDQVVTDTGIWHPRGLSFRTTVLRTVSWGIIREAIQEVYES